jgi:hypothetical protein
MRLPRSSAFMRSSKVDPKERSSCGRSPRCSDIEGGNFCTDGCAVGSSKGERSRIAFASVGVGGEDVGCGVVDLPPKGSVPGGDGRRTGSADTFDGFGAEEIDLFETGSRSGSVGFKSSFRDRSMSSDARLFVTGAG